MKPRPHLSIIGPTHPYTGGVAHHTTRLARELAARDAEVVLESWAVQYPRQLRKGVAQVPRDKPEIETFPHVREHLRWYSPLSWVAAGRRARREDAVLLNVVTPFHAVPYTGVLLGLGGRAQRVAIVHNVLPHEPRPIDRVLMRWILRRSDVIVVHSENQARLARDLAGPKPALVVRELPSPGIISGEPLPLPRLETGAPLHLLFFGTVRHYKGVDVLLRALALVDDATLTVAGDFWEPLESYQALAEELGISQRVDFRPGYAKPAEIPGIFAEADVLVLPYRSGTASTISDLAEMFRRPTIASNVGTLGSRIRDGIDGISVEPEDPSALADAIRRISDPAELRRLADGIGDALERERTDWARYAEGVLGA